MGNLFFLVAVVPKGSPTAVGRKIYTDFQISTPFWNFLHRTFGASAQSIAFIEGLTLNNRRNKKTSNKIDWNNFTLQIHVSHFLVFMIQILLSIELPNNGALGKKGDYYIEEEGGFYC